jgi:hypothetical protein
MWYTLDENNKIVEANVETFDEWIQKNPLKKPVKQEFVDKIYISTVFLGLDHSYGGTVPLLWETMIFEGSLDGYQERYTSYEEAVKGHEFAVQMVKNDLLKEKL